MKGETKRTYYPKGRIVFREGDPGDCMYVVESGRIGIYAAYGTPEEKQLTELGEGSFFGEMAMVRGLPRSATAVVMGNDTIVRTVTWETLGTYFREAPAKVVGIMQQMGRRIEELSEDYIGACSAVTELMEQRGALLRENAEMYKRIEKLEQAAGTYDPAGMPIWRPIDGETRGQEDERFRRYMEEYRRYRAQQ